MSYSKSLAARIQQVVGTRRGVVEKKMFGGVGFLFKGNMMVGVWQNSLIARLGAEQADEALRQPHVREFDITGRAMKGWVMVEPEGVATAADLHDWVTQAVTFVKTLPAK